MSLRQQHEALAVSNPVHELAYLHCVTGFKVSAIPRQQTTGNLAIVASRALAHGPECASARLGAPTIVVHRLKILHPVPPV